MKVVIQRVQRAWIKSWEQNKLLSVFAIKTGVVVYVGFARED